MAQKEKKCIIVSRFNNQAGFRIHELLHNLFNQSYFCVPTEDFFLTNKVLQPLVIILL